MKTPSTTTLLRIAAVVSVLYCAGHMSGYPWTPGASAEAEAVVRSMRDVSFDAVGAQRTYWDFYFGFGLICGAFLLMQGLWLWALASIARRDARAVVPAIAVTIGGVLANAYLSFRYFFAPPGVFSLVIAALLSSSVWAALARESHALEVSAV